MLRDVLEGVKSRRGGYFRKVSCLFTFLEIAIDKAAQHIEFRVLILGCGEAGKSTFIKQMQILRKEGFSEKAKRERKPAIAENIMEALLTLLENLTFVEETALRDKPSLSQAMDNVNDMNDRTPRDVLERANDIKLLWESQPIQAVYARRNKFQIVECAKFFLSKVRVTR